MALLGFILSNAATLALPVIGWCALFVLLGVAVAVVVVTLAQRRGFLAQQTWPRRAIFALWILGVPALLGIEGLFVGAGSGAAQLVHDNHMTARIADVAVRSVVEVAFDHPEAQALLVKGRFPIDSTAELFELLPRTLGATAVERIEHGVIARAGEGVVAFVGVKMAKLGAALVVGSSSLARARLATPVFHHLQALDDADGEASVIELADAIITVHAEPRVEHLVDDVIAAQGLPFLIAALVLLLLPILIERVAAWLRRRRAPAA